MRKSVVIPIVILVVLVAGLLFVFYILEKPYQDIDAKYSKLNIFALDESGQKIKMDYDIFVDNELYSSGTTLRTGAILDFVPINSSFKVFGYTIENNSYYTSVTNETLATDIPYRITLRPEKVGKLSIFHSGDFSNSNNLSVEFKSFGLWKELGFCVKWSERILFVKVANYTQIEKPDIYKTFDKCYETGKTLDDGESLSVIINYERFEELSETDFIQIIGYDFDNWKNELIVSYNGVDVGGKNVLHEIKR